MEESKCAPFSPDNLLLKPYCLLRAPPVLEEIWVFNQFIYFSNVWQTEKHKSCVEYKSPQDLWSNFYQSNFIIWLISIQQQWASNWKQQEPIRDQSLPLPPPPLPQHLRHHCEREVCERFWRPLVVENHHPKLHLQQETMQSLLWLFMSWSTSVLRVVRVKTASSRLRYLTRMLCKSIYHFF